MKISSENKTSFLRFRMYFRILFFKYVRQKAAQEVFITSILPAPITKSLSEVRWQP